MEVARGGHLIIKPDESALKVSFLALNGADKAWRADVIDTDRRLLLQSVGEEGQ